MAAVAPTKRASWLLLVLLIKCEAVPSSRPFIPYRTSAFEQKTFVDHDIEWTPDPTRSKVTAFDAVSSTLCPLQFSLGMSKRPHSGTGLAFAVRHPPVIHPVFPARGPGRQVVYTTQYEHLDVLSPALLQTPGQTIKEALIQVSDFPLLLESSSFHGSPILHDVNGDGITDSIVADYDGGIYFMGLAGSPRHFHHAQVPRLYLRRQWMQSRIQEEQVINGGVNKTNETDTSGPQDPYHSYFEYYYNGQKQNDKDVLRGVSANMMDQDHEQVEALKQRRSRRVQHERATPKQEEGQEITDVDENGHTLHRRLQEEGNTLEEEQQRHEEQILENGQNAQGEVLNGANIGDEAANHVEGAAKETVELQKEAPRDVTENRLNEDGNAHERQEQTSSRTGESQDEEERFQDDIFREEEDQVPTDDPAPTEDAGGYRDRGDDYYPPGDDYAMDDPDYARRYSDFDDYYGYNEEHEEYYDPQHYLRIPPHVLCDPLLVELPKLYGNANEFDDVLFVAVSYYFDEDEYQGFFSYKRFDNTDHGDETEPKRGGYVASALMAYILGDSPRWSGQNHLDLSSDFTAPENVTVVGALPIHADTTKMGAFALATPTVADLDGNGSPEVLIGTSLGMVYAFDARQMFKRDKWPIQMRHPVESRILVEDVRGDTNLEVFVADIGGNIVCFTHEASVVWHRSLLESLALPDSEIAASSPMTLGDVNGDGILDLVLSIRIESRVFVFALNGADGTDVPRFPIEVEKIRRNEHDSDDELHQKLPQPLLVDLHNEQGHLDSYIHRNGEKWKVRDWRQTSPAPHGGSASGLHVVQPVGDKLYIIEAGSGCTQVVSIGSDVVSMVQADDVHGTSKIDLVVATEEGKIVTFESASPWHALNTWNHGEMRGRENGLAHGYSASQGIFVHDSSRQLVDIFGVYVPVTFEIFDNRPNIRNEQEKRDYTVEIRDGTSSKRTLWRKQYKQPGVYTEKVYIRYGPGFYSLSVVLRTTHGLVYEDTFPVRYNVHFLDGFGILLWVPLLLASIAILFCGSQKRRWDDEELDGGREGQSLGILGRALPT